MRALPADSLEYFGDTPVGKTALTEARAAGAGGLAAGGAGAAVGAGAGVAAAVAPHCVLRNSFQVCPPRLPPDFAAWYLALHSLAVSAPADDAKIRDNPVASAATEIVVVERMRMGGLPLTVDPASRDGRCRWGNAPGTGKTPRVPMRCCRREKPAK